MVRGEFTTDYAPRSLEKYTYPRLAEQMAEAVEEAIAVHQSAQRNGD